jgi:hypothetical protein
MKWFLIKFTVKTVVKQKIIMKIGFYTFIEQTVIGRNVCQIVILRNGVFPILIALSIFVLPSSVLITPHPSFPHTPSLYPQPLTARESDTQPDSEKRTRPSEAVRQPERKSVCKSKVR